MAVIGAVAALAKVFFDGSDDPPTGGEGRVELRQVIVRNGLIDLSSVGGKLEQTKASTPQLDITVRNTGSGPVLLTRVRIAVVDSARLAICEYGIGDAIPASWQYAIELPVLPLPSERLVSRALHQEVKPGEVDRFKVLLRVPWSAQENYVYALRVDLLSSENGQRIDLGGFVVGVPDTVDRRERFLPLGPTPFTANERLMSTWCARRNMTELRRILRGPGKRSSSMAALSPLKPADWWSAFADTRSPRLAAELLLRRWRTEGPVLAVFAAATTSDAAFEESVRSRAAAALLRQAEHALRLPYPYAAWAAVMSARHASRFSPSTEARELLAEAESRWAVAKKELDTNRP